MECSNCGMQIPYSGRVCPHPGADKSADQQYHFWNVVVAVPLGPAGFVFGGPVGVVIGVFIAGRITRKP
jgi:hypothetical protein